MILINEAFLGWSPFGGIYMVITFFMFIMEFPGGSEVKASTCNAGDLGSIPGSGRFPAIPGSGRFPGERNGNPPSILAWKIPWTEEPGGL